MGRVYRYGSASCELVLDVRYAPVYITCWRGKATVEAAKWHAQQVDEFIEAIVPTHPKLVAIDCSVLSAPPSGDVRRYFAERLAALPERNEQAIIEHFVVVPNAMIRGALTAIGWLNEKAKALRSVPTMEAALRGTFDVLDAAGVPRPEGLDMEYVSPGAMSWLDRHAG